MRRSDAPAATTLVAGGRGVAPGLRAFASLKGRGVSRWKEYFWSGLSIVLLTLVAKAIEPWVGYPNIDLFYLVPVIAAATLFGLKPGIATGIASGLVYNFFFLPPRHTFAIHDPQDVITAIVLVLVAVVTSQLAGRVRAQAQWGEQSALENAAIAAFAGSLGALSDEGETARTVCSGVSDMFDVETIVLSPDHGVMAVAASTPGSRPLEANDLAAAGWTFERGEPAGLGAATPFVSDWQFWPLIGGLGTLAVVGVSNPDATAPIKPDRLDVFAKVVDRAARAYERLRVEAEARHVTALRERDQLRATLLSSIGHDLRTPLTAVTAAAEALVLDEQNEELVSTIRSEARRLSRFFDDLIDVTRIESGALAPKVEAVDLTDAVAAALDDLKLTLEGRPISLDVPANLPLVRTDPNLLHHILINLLDNAAKFSPDRSQITLLGEKVKKGVELSVLDEGQGIPVGREGLVFDTFTRLEGSDRTGGTGLGLAIVKGFAEAMGLSVSAANRLDSRGARVSMIFPPALLLFPGVEE